MRKLWNSHCNRSREVKRRTPGFPGVQYGGVEPVMYHVSPTFNIWWSRIDCDGSRVMGFVYLKMFFVTVNQEDFTIFTFAYTSGRIRWRFVGSPPALALRIASRETSVTMNPSRAEQMSTTWPFRF